MAAISTHLHHKPYQVAISKIRYAELRKWNHLGTTHCESHATAAYKHGEGAFVRELPSPHGVVFQFTDNFVHVGFGS